MKRLLWLLGLLFPLLAVADDCTRDPRRAEDCLRTPGFAQPVAGAIATAVTILVNGKSLPPLFFPPDPEATGPDDGGDGEGEDGGDDGGDDGDDPKKRNYTLDIRTTNSSTVLSTDGLDSLWVYGQVRCDDHEVDTGSLTASLAFDLQGTHADWVFMGDPVMSDGFQAVELWASPPDDESTLDDDPRVTVTLSASIEGNDVSGPVTITLEPDDFSLDVEFVDEDIAAAGDDGSGQDQGAGVDG